MANWSSHVKRILVVGGGLIGLRHLEAVKVHPECSLVGLADPNMSLDVDAPRFASMAEVTASVDGVIIATPTHLHAAHGLKQPINLVHLTAEAHHEHPCMVGMFGIAPHHPL
ncbi:Gfo/Idh/MocA family oxidoreductase [Planktomarina temperata]|nr:Gfo/Idh/MocA family oxidoreductase [Planktomarina temperata]